MASEEVSISCEMLFTLSGVLVTGSKLVPKTSLVFPKSEVRTEVLDTGEKVLFPCNMKGAEGEVVVKMGSREDGELVSPMEVGLVQDISSGPLLMTFVISDCGNF